MILRFIKLPFLPIWTCTLSNRCQALGLSIATTDNLDSDSRQYYTMDGFPDHRDTLIHSHTFATHTFIHTFRISRLMCNAFRLRAQWKPTKAWEENRPQHYGDQTSSFAKMCPSRLIQDFSSRSHVYIAPRFSVSFTKTSCLPSLPC